MQNLLYAAVVIGALRVKGRNRLYKATVQTLIKCVFTDCHSTKTAGIEHFFLLCCFTSQSTAMVMPRWSVNLTTLFPGQA